MKSLLEFITDRENIPKREDIPKRDKDMPKEDMTKEDIPKEDIHKEDNTKENIPKIDKDTPKEDIINTENKVNENKVYNFKSGVSSIGFKRIKIYRF